MPPETTINPVTNSDAELKDDTAGYDSLTQQMMIHIKNPINNNLYQSAQNHNQRDSLDQLPPLKSNAIEDHHPGDLNSPKIYIS